MTARKAPNLTEIVGMFVLQHFGIPHEVGKRMSRKEIVGLLEVDHSPVDVATATALGWTPEHYNHPSNLWGRLSHAHAIKTAKIDVPLIAKGKRLTISQEDHRRIMLAKSGNRDEAPEKIKRKRAWPTQKMRSRGFPTGRQKSS